MLRVTRLLAFGDSMTEGVVSLTSPTYFLATIPVASYPLKLQALLAERYVNQMITVGNAGRGGERTDQGLRRLPSALVDNTPEVVLLLEGVNDLNTFGSPGMRPALANIEEMIRVCRGRGAAVMVATLPPQRPGGFRAYSVELIQPFNTALKDVVRTEGAISVDLYNGFENDLSLIGSDGLHPTEAGYARIARVFYDSIRETFEHPGVVSSNAFSTTHIEALRHPGTSAASFRSER